MGVNLFFVRNVFNIKTGELIIGAAPFVINVGLFLIILLFVRQESLWLPGMMAK
jgi:TRAP-type C4-dicarboxylate transport system permease large subunit